MTKDDLRKELLERRRRLTPGEVADASRRISERFFGAVDLASIRVLHTFIRIAKFNELDTSMIYMRLWRDRPQITTAAPRIDHATGEMDAVIFDETTVLVKDRWGIRESSDGEVISPTEIDIVLVPMLGFDRLGHRVGYGKGFYDRFLTQTAPGCLKIGLCHWGPQDTPIETHPADIPLDLCITPDAVFHPERTPVEANDWSN
ncbi:MAG: 5-formyltetrahydrofolate cyclo-ligase [Acidobacteria bacterium]|nr:5-formyltetrahydrofolate cyclo-ligase [Acidobacteriota bacterium]